MTIVISGLASTNFSDGSNGHYLGGDGRVTYTGARTENDLKMPLDTLTGGGGNNSQLAVLVGEHDPSIDTYNQNPTDPVTRSHEGDQSHPSTDEKWGSKDVLMESDHQEYGKVILGGAAQTEYVFPPDGSFGGVDISTDEWSDQGSTSAVIPPPTTVDFL